MVLSPGARLGSYEVVDLLGAGGMGEVYRARDIRLGRDVAIKILPDRFVNDAARLARFEREARTLAALNHPSIGAIYGYEEAGGIHGLILELVEGPTLADRIATGPLAIKDALTIAQQVADALEAAHDKGIVHRDLKPANIKLAPDGRVKVLDFGLAKTFQEESPDLSQITTMPGGPTRAGMILGTPSYMSPEQTRGAAVDRRTDIWAFGCVLYEMLTGRQAFPGATLSDTIAAILERDPRWDALPTGTAPAVRQLLARCLEKDQRRRVRDIGDARLELADALEALGPSRSADRRIPRRWLAPAIVTLVMLIVAGAIAAWMAMNRSTSFGPHARSGRLSDGNRASSNAEANAYYERALLFGGVGSSDADQAQLMIERALALDPTFAAARAEQAFYRFVGVLNGQSNDASSFYKAESIARESLVNGSRCGCRAHSVLAGIYLLQGRKELVPGEVDLALEENAADPVARDFLLEYHHLNGDYARAREQTEGLLREWPLFWPAHFRLGEFLREQGDTAGAIREQELALVQNSTNPVVLASLARASIDAGDLEKARQTLNRARDQDRQNYRLRQQHALLLALEGHKADAAREMDDGLQTYASIQIYGPASAADFYAVMGDTETALSWLDRAVRMGDDREEYLRRNPLLANLRGHPRFQQIIEAVAYRRQQRGSR